MLLLALLAVSGRRWFGHAIGNVALLSLNEVLARETSDAAQLARTEAQLSFSTTYLSEDSSTWRAIGLTRALLGQQDEAMEAFQHTTKPTTQLTDSYIMVGDYFWNAGQLQSAAYWYEQATHALPAQASAWQRLANVYGQSGEGEKQLTSLEMAWEIDPATSARELAVALRNMGDYESMEAVLRQTLASIPDSRDRSWWWNWLGESLRRQEKWDEAVKVYESAITEFPDDPQLLIGSGWSLYGRGDGSSMAAGLFEQAVFLQEESGIAYFALGELMAREGEYELADEWFKQAIAEDPGNCRWLRVRARTARTAGDIEQAGRLFNDALNCDPGHAHTYYELAGVYQMIADSEKAIQLIEQALVLSNGTNPSYYTLAGQIYEEAGQIDSALSAYNQAAMLDPTDEAAAEGLIRLGAQ